MISIIICSRNKTISNDLYQNITTTIGCEFELIVIDNSLNQYSIFEAYNLGIGKSTSEFLCFIHDDILFHTQGWGVLLIRIFIKNKKAGLIGIAGAKIKTKMPSAWWECPEKYHVINIIQHTNDNKIESQVVGFEQNSIQEEVVVIDGVFMVMRKIKDILFNTKMKGFHNYDLNISFEFNAKNYQILVTRQIVIEHFSNGVIDKTWYDSCLKLHQLYHNILPLKTDNLINTILDESNEHNSSIYFKNQKKNSRFINFLCKMRTHLFSRKFFSNKC